MNTKKTSPAAEPTARGTEPKQSASLSSLYPDRAGFAPRKAAPVGGVILADGVIEYNTGRDTVTIDVRNTGDRPIQVGSHFHFFEVDRYTISTFPPPRPSDSNPGIRSGSSSSPSRANAA